MRIHTDKLTEDTILIALNVEIAAERIAPLVGFKILREHRSQSRARAFEIQLDAYGKTPGDGRRVGNSGQFGSDDSGRFAATYDEWGWLLAALFELDPGMTSSYYSSADDFHEKTTDNYRPAGYFTRTTFDRFPYVDPKKPRVGHAAQRYSAEHARRYSWFKPSFAPRGLVATESTVNA